MRWMKVSEERQGMVKRGEEKGWEVKVTVAWWMLSPWLEVDSQCRPVRRDGVGPDVDGKDAYREGYDDKKSNNNNINMMMFIITSW